MISVTLGTNTSRKTIVVEESKVLRDVLTENGINISVGTVHIDGIPVSISDMGSTLAELGVSNRAYIISVAKADNA